MNNVLKKIAYHRNGVGGEGFYVAIVETDGKEMLCVTFAEEPGAIRTAVFDMDLLKKGVIEFGVNSHRGDHWHGFMTKEAIPAHGEEVNKRLGLPPQTTGP